MGEESTPKPPWKSKARKVGDEITPKPPTKSRARKGRVEEYGLADLTQQKPMPESKTPSDFGPPPAEFTPASAGKKPQRLHK